MTIAEAIAALPEFCPLHEGDDFSRRLGVDEGWIFFACGCRQSQRTGAVETPNLLDHVIMATEDSASSALPASPGTTPLQIVK